MTLPTFSVTSTDHISPDRIRDYTSRTFVKRIALGVLLLALIPGSAFGHASLVSSTPAAGSTLSKSPDHLHLVFSEPIEISVSRAVLVNGTSEINLHVRADPQNVNALFANMDSLSAGNYEIKWQVLSADGHRVSGTLRFSVGAVQRVPDTTSQKSASTAAVIPPANQGVTRIAMLFRGIGMSALMAFAGMLFFVARAGKNEVTGYFSLATTICAMAAVALFVHFVCWAYLSNNGLERNGLADVIQTSSGKREAARTMFALLALWGWWLARRPVLALVFASLGVLSAAFIGHAAAIDPAASIAFKLIHLGAATIWMGGLAWLLILDRESTEILQREAGKVSTAAGWCVLLVLISGVVQAGIILSWNPSVLTSSYAVVAGLKLLGLGILAIFGAVNRFRILPALGIVNAADKLQASVRREVTVMIIVVLLGGVLSYISPPETIGKSTSTPMRL